MTTASNSSRLLLGLGMAALVACGDSTSPARATYALTPATQWSGGSVQVSSASFANQATPVFSAEGKTLAVTRLTNLSLSVRLPATVTGPVTIFREGGGHDSVGTVDLVGLRNARMVPGSMGYDPVVPAGITPLVFIAEETVNGPVGLTVLDPATDQVTSVSGVGPVQTGFGVLPSYQTNRFVLRDSSDQMSVWQLFPAKVFQSLAAVQSTAVRNITQLSDTLWLTLMGNAYQLTTPAGTQGPFYGIGDPLRAVFSPAGDRLALVVNSAPGGQVPVLAPEAGDTAFTVPLVSAHGAAFSPHADRLYVSSRTAGNLPDSLVAVTASAGQRLTAMTLPAGYSGWSLAVDPLTDRLYQVADSSGTLALLVFNGVTLKLEGQLVCGQCGNANFWSAGLAVDAAAGRIHVAYPGSPIPVITFDRLH